jgi:type I restriction enzyme S subunit
MDAHYSLPNSWVWTSLGEVIDTSRRRVNPRDYPGLQYVGLENIESNTMRLLGTTPASDMSSSVDRFYPGDVLYGRMRPYLNKVYLAKFEGVCSSEFIVFRQVKGIAPAYLAYILNSHTFVSFASHIAEGDRPRVGIEQLVEYPFPLAPIREQHRIVEEIESYFTRLDVAVASLRRAQARLQTYKTSLLKAACEGRLVPTEAELAKAEGRDYEHASVLLERVLAARRAKWETDEWASLVDRAKQQAAKAKRKAAGQPLSRGESLNDEEWRDLTEKEYKKYLPKNDQWKQKYPEPVAPKVEGLPDLPEGWCWGTIEQIAAHEPYSITDGPFGSKLKTEHYTEDGPRVIRLQNIEDGYFRNEYAHISQSHFETLRKHEVSANDLVIAGLGETLPRACIIPEYVGPAIVKADCIKFRPHAETANYQYLNVALNSQILRNIARSIVHGVSRPRLNQQEIKSLPIPLPPYTEQLRVANEVAEKLSIQVETQNMIEQDFKRVDRLRQTILQQAYQGKLIDHHPDDESASTLLERIQAERRAREEIVKSNRNQSKETRGDKVSTQSQARRALYEVMIEAGTSLKPEELFDRAGFSVELVDSFYEELRREVFQYKRLVPKYSPHAQIAGSDVLIEVVEHED